MANESKKKKVVENKEAKKVQEAENKVNVNQEPKAKKKTQEPKKEKTNKNKRHFWKDFKAELKKVIWPTPKELANSTMAVITIVIITAVIVLALDLCNKTIFTHGIDKIKMLVQDKDQTEVTNQIDNNVVDTNSVVDAVVENTVQ